MSVITFLDYNELLRDEEQLRLLMKVEEGGSENKLSPNRETMNNILNYSKSLSVRKSESIGALEFVLN